MSLLDKALAVQVRSQEPKLVTLTRAASPKLRSEILDLLEATMARQVNYTTCGRVLSEALGAKITDEQVRKHAHTVLTEHGR